MKENGEKDKKKNESKKELASHSGCHILSLAPFSNRPGV